VVADIAHLVGRHATQIGARQRLPVQCPRRIVLGNRLQQEPPSLERLLIDVPLVRTRFPAQGARELLEGNLKPRHAEEACAARDP